VKRKYIHHGRIVHTTKKELWRTGERRGKKDIEVHIPMNKLAAAVGAHCLRTPEIHVRSLIRIRRKFWKKSR